MGERKLRVMLLCEGIDSIDEPITGQQMVA